MLEIFLSIIVSEAIKTGIIPYVMLLICFLETDGRYQCNALTMQGLPANAKEPLDRFWLALIFHQASILKTSSGLLATTQHERLQAGK